MLTGGQPTPFTMDNIRQTRVLDTFLHAAFAPIVRQLITDFLPAHSLLYPFGRSASRQPVFSRAIYSQFRIHSFLQSFIANFCQPLLKGFGFWRGDALNQTKRVFCVSRISFAHFTVQSSHFQLSDFIGQFAPLLFKLYFKVIPVLSRSIASRQYSNDIDDCKKPLFLPLVPNPPHRCVFKIDDGFIFFLLHKSKLKLISSYPDIYQLYR